MQEEEAAAAPAVGEQSSHLSTAFELLGGVTPSGDTLLQLCGQSNCDTEYVQKWFTRQRAAKKKKKIKLQD